MTAPELTSTAADRLRALLAGPHDGANGETDVLPPGYELRGRLGRGGMASVYLAHEGKLDRLVALKVAHAPDAGLRERFAREARLTAALQHPSVLPIHDYGELPDGRPYYTMRVVEGRELARVIEEVHGLPDPGEALPGLLRVLGTVLDTLQYAHERGLVHRDLTPRNVLVGRHGEVWVSDWGLVKERGAPEPAAAGRPPSPHPSLDPSNGQTHPGTVLGTPAYMAPEQARGDLELVGPATDVHAAGLLLLEIAGGRPAHAGLAEAEVLARLARGEPPPLDAGPRPLAPALRSIAARATAPRPGERYASAGEMAADVRRFLDGRPVRAHRETFAERARRVLARHRFTVALVAAYLAMRGLVLLLAGT